ncbi:MAG: ATP-dependent Clp protease proteolytic subunit [bacterium]|nr:ATP-dependent Clp protease proteolytic subunit [bacterium]
MPGNKSPKNVSLKCNFERRIVWLDCTDGPVNDRVALNFENILKKLNKANNNEVKMFISGRGGDFYACLKIMDSIKNSQSPVAIVAFNYVRSGCFLITQSENAKRIGVDGTKFEFHCAVDTYCSQDFTNKKDFQFSQIDYVNKLKNLWLVDASQSLIFAQKGRPASKIFKMVENEEVLSVRSALKYKLLDSSMRLKEFRRYQRLVFFAGTRRF